jgi:hypothetical protein
MVSGGTPFRLCLGVIWLPKVFGIPATILHAPLLANHYAGGVLEFTASVDVFGSEALNIAPFGCGIHLALASDWPHPSFDGDRLPSERTVDASGFRASCNLNASLLGLVSSYRGDVLPAPMLQSPEVSVRLDLRDEWNLG